ncbi:hypothetical protein OAP76_00815 [Alphaproteobacteria bacterium]|nr:hypothetical protein [Alphaproteobacteria bacterium]
MPYLGTPPQSGFISQEANQYFTGLTQNYIDLNQSISSLSSVIVLVNGVVQENSDLTLTSSTRITLGATLVSADKVTCIYVAKISSTQAPATGSVTSDMLSGSIANSKLSNSSITLNGSAVSLGGSATVGGDNTPAFHIRKSSTQTGLANGGWTKITFDDEVFDTDNAFASDKFVAPSNGKYLFTTGAKINPITSNDLVGSGIRFTIDGSVASEVVHFMNQNPSAAEGKTLTSVFNLTANQYVEVYAYAQDGAGQSPKVIGGNDRDTFFMGFKLIT